MASEKRTALVTNGKHKQDKDATASFQPRPDGSKPILKAISGKGEQQA